MEVSGSWRVRNKAEVIVSFVSLSFFLCDLVLANMFGLFSNILLYSWFSILLSLHLFSSFLVFLWESMDYSLILFSFLWWVGCFKLYAFFFYGNYPLNSFVWNYTFFYQIPKLFSILILLWNKDLKMGWWPTENYLQSLYYLEFWFCPSTKHKICNCYFLYQFHSLNKYLLNAYLVPGTTLDTDPREAIMAPVPASVRVESSHSSSVTISGTPFLPEGLLVVNFPNVLSVQISFLHPHSWMTELSEVWGPILTGASPCSF